jgi:hypothetical protein
VHIALKNFFSNMCLESLIKTIFLIVLAKHSFSSIDTEYVVIL